MYIADLHIHSKYSRATSSDCQPEALDFWARCKGIRLIGTGDFTHPAWRAELKEKLIPAEEGLYLLREELHRPSGPTAVSPRFVVSGEISSIYKKNGKVRKVHNLILLPSLEAAERLSLRLETIGNLHSDGRPILGLDSRDLFEITLTCCPDAVFIPAHIWTPHFSLFGAFSGFDTIEECFEDLTPHIHALETGLSSDPPMNWRISALDRFSLVSNSDAHSPSKLGREANLLDTDLSYPALAAALNTGNGLAGTLEFYPEEGKYHFDGHRNCKLCITPEEAEQVNGICPVCGKKLTPGVLHRVYQLADRPDGCRKDGGKPFESLVPLPEVIAASTGYSAGARRTLDQYERLLRELGPEFPILRTIPLSDLSSVAGPCITEGIRRLRAGQVGRSPGYDGEYGRIQLLDEAEIQALNGQLYFLAPKAKAPKSKKTAEPFQKKPEIAASLHPSDVLAEDDRLNSEQQQAVAAWERVVEVIAGPGTGKTKTLVSRIAHLVKNRSIPPENITAVTFTNKAAKEMAQRLSTELGDGIANAMTIGTFHSICLRLLGNATILDESEALSAADEVIRELSLKTSPQKLLQEISKAKNSEEIPASLRKAYDSYQERLKETGALDFDDLLLEGLRLSVSASPSPQFTHLLVDEFQDINPLQLKLIKAWSLESQSLFVIGDPDQSIYGFRGSDPECFTRLETEFAPVVRITLTKNYRSRPEILRCALPVIERNGGEERALTAVRESGAPVRLLASANDYSEAIFVAKEINRMVGGVDMLDAQGSRDAVPARGFSDIAVLYRTHRQAEALEKCLRVEGIPFVVTGREDFLTDRDVRGALAFFRSLIHSEDTRSLRICLKTVFACPEPYMRAFLLRTPQERRDAFPDSAAVSRYLELNAAYRNKMAVQTPRRLIESYIEDIGLAGSAPMERLLGVAVLHTDLRELLQTLTLGEESDIARSSSKQYTSDAVTLMTLHGSKGLEFPTVFLCGARKGILPLDMPGRASDRDEERRLFYVGITRAKEELVLLTSGEPSEFLSDVPPKAAQRGMTSGAKHVSEEKQLTLF